MTKMQKHGITAVPFPIIGKDLNVGGVKTPGIRIKEEFTM